MPTATFQIAAGADDQMGIRSGATYPPTGGLFFNSTNTEAFGERGFLTNEFRIYNGLWRWDTSSLPAAAAITSANLIFTIAGLNNTDARSAVFDWHDWSGLNAAADIAVDAPTTGLAASVSIGSVSLGALTLALNDANANVSRTGFTFLRGHVSGGQPTGLNRIIPRAFEFSASAAAKLEVEYTDTDTTPPAAPTGLAATVITE